MALQRLLRSPYPQLVRKCCSLLQSGNVLRERTRGAVSQGCFLSSFATSIGHIEERLEKLIELRVHTTHDYLVVLRHLAENPEALPDAAIRAEKLLNRWEKDVSSPDLPSEAYQRVIEAWGKAHHEKPNLVQTRAQRWLIKSSEHQTSIECFNAFLDICSKGRKGPGGKKALRERAQKSEAMLEYMMSSQRRNPQGNIRPNTESFNFVIRSWTRCRNENVVDRVENIVRLMTDYGDTTDKQVQPNEKTYAMLLDAMSVRVKLRVNQQKESTNDDKIDEVLDRIEQMRMTLGSIAHQCDASLTTSLHNTLIAAWSHAAEVYSKAPYEAEHLLQSMETAPDSFSYLLVMRSWQRSQHSNRAERVLWWLSKQKDDAETLSRLDLYPTVECFNAVIRTFSDKHEPERAEAVMVDLIENSQEQSGSQLRPDSESFIYMIKAWLNTAERGDLYALRRAVHWLHILINGEQQGLGLKTSVDLYTKVLQACSKQEDYPEVLKIAEDVFENLTSSHHVVNSGHYVSMLQTVLVSLSREEHTSERRHNIMALHKDSCERGLLSSRFISSLANGPTYLDGWTIEESARMTGELYSSWPLDSSWFRNITQQGLIPKKENLFRTNHTVKIREKMLR